MKFTQIIIALLFISSITLSAQNGKIRGTVRDKLTNSAVPFANIIVANTTNGTATNENGYFEISNIEADFVRLQISCLGYEPFTSEVINISRITAVTVNLEMEPTSKSLSEVKVTAQPFTKRPESPVSLQSIGVDLIEKSAGANRDISKVLQSFPGVGSVVSFRNDLIVRGGGPSENRFYLDGIEIPTLNHFSTQGASGGPVGILNVDFIREVDFYSGAFPASRGNALSSVFEFKQIDGNSDKPSFKASVGASEMSFSVNSPLTSNTTLIASARRSYLQFLFSQLGLPFLPTFNDFSIKTKTRFNQKNELTILAVGAIDQFKLNLMDNPDEEAAYILGYLPVNTQWNYATGASFKHFFGNSYITLVASRNKLNNQAYKYFNNIETPANLIYDYKSNETENKLRAEFNARPNDFSINIGASYEVALYDNNTYTKLFVNNLGIEQLYKTDLQLNKYGVFANVAHPYFNQRLTVSLGVRADGSNYASSMSNMLEQISPRLSATYRLSIPFTLSASVGKYYQLPAYTTLGYKDSFNQYINKNNGLKYISANHYIAGLEYKPNDNTKLSIEGFIKNYFDYPFSVTDGVSLASKGSDYGVFGDEEVTPTSTGKTSGFEILARQQSVNGLSFIMAYTYVRSEFTDANNKLVPSSWDSKHLFTATINKKLKRNWDVGAKWRFVGGLPYTPNDELKSSYVAAWDIRGRAYLDYSQFNTQRLSPFHQLDLRIDKSYYFKNWSLSVYFDIQNAYNRQSKNPKILIQETDAQGNPIIIDDSLPANEQQYKLKTLQTTSGTVLPAIGLMIEF